MDAVNQTVKFYYDFKSPFTYLALAPALDLERSHRVTLRFIPRDFEPRVAYGGELEQRQPHDWNKVRYLYEDVRRFANQRGMIIRGPQKLFDSRLAMMSGCFADRHTRFREYAPMVFERYASSDGPGDLELSRTEADRDGVFGVPTFIVAGEPFWGNDRINWVIKKLDAMSLRRATADRASQ
jgi:2-hydroxychromene-2-carboxylate isomerase